MRTLLILCLSANLCVAQALPKGAKIIETAEVKPGRRLVLWMVEPKKELRDPNIPSCPDQVYGDHWTGLTRLSLIDPANGVLINTVEVNTVQIRGWHKPIDGMRIPFFVLNRFYTVPKVNRQQEGKPRILALRDLTGDGIAGQFVLFDHGPAERQSPQLLGTASKRTAPCNSK